MREWLFNKLVARQEKFLGAKLDYLRAIGRESMSALLKISVIAPLVRHRRKLQRAAYHLATITVTRLEDCGACTQIAVNLARRDGVPAHLINAALRGEYFELPLILAEVCEFAHGVAQGNDNPVLRQRLRLHYGEEGMIELAMAISMARVYPTLKRALGYAQACQLPALLAPEEKMAA